MAAIISDKFRIFNAKQFLTSLGDEYFFRQGNGSVVTPIDGPEIERSRMYFFVGRPQRWDAFVEILNSNSIAFEEGHEVYVGASYAAATFKAKVRAANDSSLLLFEVFPTVNSVPGAGAVLKGYFDGSDTGAQATAGVYRYATEDVPPVPLDNQKEKFDVYDDLIAAKRITTDYARPVIRRYNWDVVANPKFDMWKPDYSATPSSGGQVGKQAATGATSISEAKYYVMNSNYEVFKCLYNGESPAWPVGQNATYEPKTTPSSGQGTYSQASGIFAEGSGGMYLWKYMYTIPTDDVLRFLSTDFMPIVLPSNPSRQATEALAVAGSINAAVIRNFGSGFSGSTYYAPIIGDGTGGKVKITAAAGAMTGVEVVSAGSGYTYASIPLVNGTGSGATAYGLFTNEALTTAASGLTLTGAIDVIIPTQGGHGFDFELELNAKRVMTNVRLSYAEGAGDFPVDNDFRRIGIIADPFNKGTTNFATADTLSGIYAVKINNATADYAADERITQTVTGGVAHGKVVSWTLDSGSTTSGVLKYIQTPEYHRDNGVVRAFESNAGNPITGQISLAEGTVDTTNNSSLLGVTFTAGLSTPEIENNSGDIIYMENRRLITRAADQIEDIKLVIEF
jgi:hypothetical protein